MNKRKISLIMSFILIFSLIVPVFAETILVDTGNKSENISNEINIDENNNKDLLINDNSSLNSEITIDNSNNLEEMQSGQGNKGEEPAQDFNEEIIEFKQYTEDDIEDRNNIELSEHIEKKEINKVNNEYNTIENIFTLEAKPISEGNATEEPKATPLNLEQNNAVINTIKGPTDTDFTLSPQKIDYSALYQNKISVQTASTPMTDTTIFYDVENAKPKFVNWKGILKGVDVSDIEKQGYKVEIHSNEENYSKDLSEQGWHLFESTQDLSKIKSLAFKILDKNNKAAVLPEEKLFSIILNMQVPEESKVSKVDGKPTHSYSNVYAQWRGTNESEVHGIHSETVKLSLKDSIIDDIEAKGNHQIIVEREYIGNFSESKKNLNRIIILKGRNNNKKYRIYKDKIGFVEPDIYDIEYIISKDVKILEDSTKEIGVKETFEDSLDKIKVKYQVKENISTGYTDSDQKENLYAITLK